MVLFGESGAGKSLFLIKLVQEILKNNDFDSHLIVYYKLADLCSEGDTTEQLKKLLRHVEQYTLNKKDRPILLFLDAFNELNNRSIGIS